MVTLRRKLAAVPAALCAACFLMLPLAGGAQAAKAPVEIYDAGGHGQGIVTTFAVKPSIFDPLLQGGIVHSQAELSSQGGGNAYALSSLLFPGRFAVGAIGCAGLPGSQWLQAYHPPSQNCKSHTEFTGVGPARSSTFSQERCFGPACIPPRPEADAAINAVLENSRPQVAHIRSSAGPRFSESTVVLGEQSFGPEDAPLVEVSGGVARTVGRLTAEGTITHHVVVTLNDVSLLNGAITIDQIVSTARTESDGTTASADADILLAGARAVTTSGTHAIAITPRGIHVTDDRLSREQQLSFSDQINDSLLQGGVGVSLATPNEIVEGTSADAAVGGLMITTRGRIPSSRVPRELTPALGQVIQQVPTMCGTDARKALVAIDDGFAGIPQIPLCVGAGALPGPSSSLAATISIASAQSFAVGSLGFQGPTGPVDGGTTTGTTGSFGPGAGPAPVVDGGTGAVGDTTTGTTGTGGVTEPPTQGPVTRYGFVARMPAAPLAWGGVAFLVLAVRIAGGPSLRRAEAG